MSRMKDDPLAKARRLHAFGRWKKLTLLLEPMIPLYRNSAEFYRLLGSSFLRLEDYLAAVTYLNRAQQLAPSDRDICLCLVAALVARGDDAAAAGLCLGILEGSPDDPYARRAMDIIRSRQNSGRNGANVVIPRIDGILPDRGLSDPHRRRIFVWIVEVVFLVLAVAGVLVFMGKGPEEPGQSGPEGRIVSGAAVVFGPAPGDVLADPEKFANAKVRWRGVASNTESLATGGSFLLVAGSVDLKLVEALVKVVCAEKPPAAGSAVEVEGRIVTKGTRFTLEAERVVLITGEGR